MTSQRTYVFLNVFLILICQFLIQVRRLLQRYSELDISRLGCFRSPETLQLEPTSGHTLYPFDSFSLTECSPTMSCAGLVSQLTFFVLKWCFQLLTQCGSSRINCASWTGSDRQYGRLFTPLMVLNNLCSSFQSHTR